jgi:hypothetical protein
MADITQTRALPAPFIETLGKTFGEQLGRLTPTAIDTGKFAPEVAPQIQGGFTQAAQQAAATQAGLGALQFDATTGAVSGMGAGTGISGYQGFLDDASALTGTGAGTGAGSIASYQSPYTGAVKDAMEAQMLQEHQRQGNVRSAQAVGAGAFGGGRFGAETAVADSQYAQNLAAMQAQMDMQGFQQASAARQGDLRNLQGLAQLQPQLAGQEIGQLGQMGQAGLGYRQAITDADAQAQKLSAYEPYQRTGFMGEQLTGLMGGYPGGSRMQITPTASPLQQGLMTGLGGAAAYKGLSGIFK